MKEVFQSVLSLLVVAAAIILISGCKKKESIEVPAPTAAATPAASAQVAASVSTYQEVHSAMETKNYDQATSMMLKMGGSVSQMTPAQAEAYAEQMRSFQQSLAAAAAAGDQQAMEAARKLAQNRHR